MNKIIDEIADNCNGIVDEVINLGDGSGAAILSFELPKDHWIYKKNENDFETPPMPFRMGINGKICLIIWDEHNAEQSIILSREQFINAIIASAKYGVKCATMNGEDDDFSPDALVRNIGIGACGYNTLNGLGSEDWLNPDNPYEF